MKKLLIVDDSADLLDAMKFFLEKRGFLVTTITNTADITKTVLDVEPDLIVLDVFIAGTDGREICRALRKNIITKYLCIMLFSASPTAIKDYHIHGADGCIEKPFNLEDIILNIESVMHKCRDYKYN